MLKRNHDPPSPSSGEDATTPTELELQYAASRLLKAGGAAQELLSPCRVKLVTVHQARVVSLIIDESEVAVFGPGHPVECADAVYAFVTHLTSRVKAEA